MKGKLKELTREDLDKLRVPGSPQLDDFPKDREFEKTLSRFIELRNEAARELTGDDEGRPSLWRRILEVLHVTGLKIEKNDCLSYKDEIEIYRAAAKMKRQQKVELQEGLKKAIADLASTKQNASPVKGNRIWHYFLDLYERTSKAFFDSVLGKYGPK